MWWIIGYLIGSILAAIVVYAAMIVGKRSGREMEEDE
jgi:hypothetical protein